MPLEPLTLPQSAEGPYHNERELPANPATRNDGKTDHLCRDVIACHTKLCSRFYETHFHGRS
jgi:hypothetical protein